MHKRFAVNEQTKSKLKRLLQSISQHAIQEVPPEMYACEICRRTDCSQDEWIVCENRIAHAKCLEERQDTAGS
jgi:transcription initiation factor IIE alpha subunit